MFSDWDISAGSEVDEVMPASSLSLFMLTSFRTRTGHFGRTKLLGISILATVVVRDFDRRISSSAFTSPARKLLIRKD